MTRDDASFTGFCDLLEGALSGPQRDEILDHALAARGPEAVLKRLRSSMAAHSFRAGAATLELTRSVRAIDRRTRQEGFHVLLEWEQAAGRVSRDEIPVLMLDHFAATERAAAAGRRELAVLLDFYFLYLLGLGLMRAWDEGDPNANLERIAALLARLQGPGGSGRRLAGDPATLLFIATSNFQPDDLAYHRFLRKVWTLDPPHRVQVARIGAPVVGTHLRWALSAIYERDLAYMRKDNFVDYPWLFFSVATLMEEYARLAEGGGGAAGRAALVGALLNGLSPDPWAFVEPPPEALAQYTGEHERFRELLLRHRDALLTEMEALEPSRDAYSPISLQFNFPHNVLVAAVVLDLMGAGLPNLPLDALLASPPDAAAGTAAQLLARGLTGFSAAHPERRGDRRVLQVAYNESIGLRSYSRTMTALRNMRAATS